MSFDALRWFVSGFGFGVAAAAAVAVGALRRVGRRAPERIATGALLLLALTGCALTARLHHDAPTPVIAPLVTPRVEAEDRPRCHESNLRCACALWALGQLIGEEQYEATQVARQPPRMSPEAHRLSDAEAQAEFERLDAASRCKDCRTGARGFATQPGAKPQPVPVDADGWPLADLDVKPPVCNGSQQKAPSVPAPNPTPAGLLSVGPGSDSAPCLFDDGYPCVYDLLGLAASEDAAQALAARVPPR
jgi:hypothetical protein